jgi:hypothetical protein
MIARHVASWFAGYVGPKPSIPLHLTGRGADLELGDIVTRYRLRSDGGSDVVEAASWWALRSGELLALWPHHARVSAMGLGRAVMEAFIIDVVDTVAVNGGGLAVRIAVPSAEMLTGLVPVCHAVVRASGIDPAHIIVAIDVELAVDPDLLPIIVHLRTLGMRIDIVGLDALTATLHTVSDTSPYSPQPTTSSNLEAGPWVVSFAEVSSHRA